MSGGVRDMLRRAGLGRLAYRVYYRPRSFVRDVRAQGVGAWFATQQGRRAMQRAAMELRLPELREPEPQTPTIHFVTGRDFWHQTAFCVWSLQITSGRRFSFVIHDDGSLSREAATILLRVMPAGSIRSADEAERRLDGALPEAEYPLLRQRHRTKPHMRKWLDVFAGSTGAQLFLDSDVLFWRRPDVLLEWMRDPSEPLFMVDRKTSYGYPMETLAELAGCPMPERVNVGVVGWRAEGVPFRRMEEWTRALEERHGTSYYLDQTLGALCASQNPFRLLPESDYLCAPSPREIESPTAAMHHYVAETKALYHRIAWKRAQERPIPR
jgi:hypothetical protein